MTSNGSVEILTTIESEPSHRAKLWQEHVAKVCGVLDVTYDTDFNSGTIVTGRMGEMRLSLITADGHAVRRTRHDARVRDSHIYLMAPLHGSVHIRQDDHDVTVGRNEVVSLDSSRPYALASRGALRLAALRFPHSVMGLTSEATRPLTALPWSAANGVAAVANVMITTLAAELTELSEAEMAPLGDTIDGMVRSLFAERMVLPDDPGVSARRELLLKIQNYALEHLKDPRTNPRTLAAHHNISLRYLQLLFAEQGSTPARWLRDERLARCRDALSNPRLDHLTVSAIGARWGLGDGSQMSRLFRQAYGVVPSEFRRRSAAFAGG